MMLFCFLAGILGGLLGGMGMGGGTLLIPLLTLFLEVPQKVAQTLNLLSFLPMSFLALAVHLKNRLVDKRHILVIAIPAVCTAVLSSLLAKDAPPELLRQLFGWFLVCLGSLFLVSSFFKKRNNV